MESIKMLGRGLVVGASIAFATFMGGGLYGAASNAAAVQTSQVWFYILCYPPFGVIVPATSLAMADHYLLTSRRKLGFWLTSVVFTLLALAGTQIAASIYEVYHQSFKVSNNITVIGTAVVGLLFGFTQWIWFKPCSIRQLTWMFGPMLCWFIPAIPWLMLPPGYRG